MHLSTPEQVHLPAERLFPGRRDLVLLVVDPARLTDPVRLEPGDPDGSGGHAVPAPLRAAAGDRRDRRRPVPAAGAARSCPRPTTCSAGRWRSTRRCRSGGRSGWATSRAGSRCSTPTSRTPATTTGWCSPTPVDADTVERAGGGGGRQRRLAAPRRRAALARAPARSPRSSADRGWRRRGAGADGPPGRADRRRGRAPRWWTRARCTSSGSGRGGTALRRPGRDLDGVVAELVGREQLNDAVVAVTDLVVRRGGRVVASGQLRHRRRDRGGGLGADRPGGARPRARRRRAGAGARPGRRRRLRPRRPGGGGRRLAAALVRAGAASRTVGSVWCGRPAGVS